MTKRIIEVAERAARLWLENRLLVVRDPDGGEHRVPIGEIECVLLGTPAVSVTGALLAALAEAGVMVVQTVVAECGRCEDSFAGAAVAGVARRRWRIDCSGGAGALGGSGQSGGKSRGPLLETAVRAPVSSDTGGR